MLGLIFAGGALLYAGFIAMALRWAWRVGRADGGSLLKGVVFAAGGLLIALLPILWAALPTTLAHREFCAIDAGFRQRLGPELWARQSADLIGRLRGLDVAKASKTSRTPDGFDRSVDFVGARAWDSRITAARKWGIDVVRLEARIVDIPSGAVLAESVDYQTGTPEHPAFWLRRRSCFGNEASPVDQLIQYSRNMREFIK